MREPNFSVPAQNRATVVISSTLYDRRALDCTATLPLVNSLTHLAYMTSTSSRIREILAADGGLERLVKILATCQRTDKHTLWKWSLAFQCVVNIGVRGTEAIRSRVVETGTVHVVLSILENFLKALDQARTDNEQDQRQLELQPPAPSLLPIATATALALPVVPPTHSRSTPIIASANASSSCSPRRILYTGSSSNGNSSNSNSSSNSSENSSRIEQRLFTMAPKRRTFLTRSAKPKSKPVDSSLSSIPMLNNLSVEDVLHREEDILFSLQLLAYLSKYPHIRESFHKNYSHNVFSVVEKFTHRLHPSTVIYWAGVIMRNACRKDEARGGIRQCAYMHCGKWERFPREFAKCRRCRKAKYCSKQCQSKAWGEGHRWWCVERQHAPVTTTTTTTITPPAPAPTPSPAPATATGTAATPTVATAPTAAIATQPQIQQQDPVGPVNEDHMMDLDHSTAANILTIPLDQRHPTSDMDEDPHFSSPDHHHHLQHHTAAAASTEQRHSSVPEPSRQSPSSRLGDQSRRSHRRHNSHLTHDIPSGSSTEAEADVGDRGTMMMVIDG